MCVRISRHRRRDERLRRGGGRQHSARFAPLVAALRRAGFVIHALPDAGFASDPSNSVPVPRDGLPVPMARLDDSNPTPPESELMSAVMDVAGVYADENWYLLRRERKDQPAEEQFFHCIEEHARGVYAVDRAHGRQVHLFALLPDVQSVATPAEQVDPTLATEPESPGYFLSIFGPSFAMSHYGMHEAIHPVRVRDAIQEVAGTPAADVIAGLVREVDAQRQRLARLQKQRGELDSGREGQ